jgi:molecular chaperone DnaK
MSLGHFRLEGILPAPRGVPQVEVAFDIDANGIINVTARDKATSREQKITITASTNLNKSEIERMVQDARKNESEDRKRRELIEARNVADSLAYQTEKTLRELGDRISATDQQEIQRKIENLRETLKSDDLAQIKRQSDDLQNAFHAISQQLYAQQTGQQVGQQPGGNGNGHVPGSDGRSDEGEVVEGEFRSA